MKSRILGITLSKVDSTIYAIDYSGVLFKCDFNLNIIDVASPLTNMFGCPIIVSDQEDQIYGRDYMGNIVWWDGPSVQHKGFLSLKNYYTSEIDPEEVSSVPNTCHGLRIWKDQIITVNSYGELTILNKNEFCVEEVLQLGNTSFYEGMNFEFDDFSLLSDTSGHLWIGSVQKREFQKSFLIGKGACHDLKYDQIFDRFWITDDHHCGILLLDKSTMSIQRLFVSRDDVEWIAFNKDQSLVYVACFDHYLHVFENKKFPELIKKIGPFKFQLKQVEFYDDQHIFVLLESGEIYLVDGIQGQIKKQNFGTNCIWDFQSDVDDPSIFHCALESGEPRKIQITGGREKKKIELSLIENKNPPFFNEGRLRRVIPLIENHCIYGATSGAIFRVDQNHQVVWSYQSSSIVRDLSLSIDSKNVCVVNEAGELIVLDVGTGELSFKYQHNKPLWATLYLNQKTVLFGERVVNRNDEHAPCSSYQSFLHFLDLKSKEKTSIPFNGNIKQIKRFNENILLCGNGNIAARELDQKGNTLRLFEEWQLNTCEDIVIHKDLAFTCTYGYQLNTYEMDGSIIDSQFTLENYTKRLRIYENEGQSYLLASGRPGFISVYSLENRIPELMKNIFV